MPRKFEKVIEKLVRQYHLEPAECEQPAESCGRCYSPRPNDGEGKIWFCSNGTYHGMMLMDETTLRDLHIALPYDYEMLAYFQHVDGSYTYQGVRHPLMTDTLYTNAGKYADMPMTIRRGTRVKCVIIFWDPVEGRKEIIRSYPAYGNLNIEDMMGLKNIHEVPMVMAQIEKCPINDTTEYSLLFYRCKLGELLSLYAGALTGRPKVPENASVKADDLEQIRALQRYIQANLTGELDLDHLAKLAHMSKSKLKYTFKNVTGKTVGEYLNEVRMVQARKLLETEKPVTEIAAAVGFVTSSSFSRFFKQEQGMTPKEYRKRIIG